MLITVIIVILNINNNDNATVQRLSSFLFTAIYIWWYDFVLGPPCPCIPRASSESQSVKAGIADNIHDFDRVRKT